MDPWHGILIHFVPLSIPGSPLHVEGVSEFEPGSMLCLVKNLLDTPVMISHKHDLGWGVQTNFLISRREVYISCKNTRGVHTIFNQSRGGITKSLRF